MQEKFPTVSVIIPTYNAELTIENTVRSVMNQNYTDWELLIVDDFSIDNTINIVKSLEEKDERIKIYSCEKNVGVAQTRNLGVKLAVGEYIAFLDSDDTWEPEKLTRQMQTIVYNNADLCYTSYSMVDINGEKIKHDFIVPETTDFESLLKINVINSSSVLVRAKVVQQNPFNSDFYHEDYLLWLTLLKKGYKVIGCTECLTNLYLRKDSRSANKLRSAKNRWIIYRKALNLSFPKSVKSLVAYTIAAIRKYR